MTTTYSLDAGSLDSILKVRSLRTGHATRADALAALARVEGCDADDYVTVRDAGDGSSVYVYHSQADADADATGARAVAVVRPAIHSEMVTADLVDRLDEIRDELGDAWQPGWAGVVDAEAAAIIDELRSRGTGQAERALADHGLANDEA